MVEPRRILYGVSSVGLGHARRSLVIARKIRELNPLVQIDWICAEPVNSFLKDSGELTLASSSNLESMGYAMESVAKEGRIDDMSKVARLSSEIGRRNYEKIKPHIASHDFLIQDEYIETLFSFLWDESPPLPSKRAVITDYVRFETPSWNPYNRLIIWYANRALKKAFMNQSIRIFTDDREALPAHGSTRSWALKNFHIAGPVIDDSPAKSRGLLKRELFHIEEKKRLITFTIGGTSIGLSLVDFVVRHAKEISSSLDSHLAVLLGPKFDPSLFSNLSKDLTLVGFTSHALVYFKAADCVVSQAGASTLNEVASLGVPCVCVPIKNHWEQNQNAFRFAVKCNFEILEYDRFSVKELVKAVERAISRKYEPVQNVNAPTKIARLISESFFA